MVAGVIPGEGGGIEQETKTGAPKNPIFSLLLSFRAEKKRHDKMTRGGMKAGNVHVTSLFFPFYLIHVSPLVFFYSNVIILPPNSYVFTFRVFFSSSFIAIILMKQIRSLGDFSTQENRDAISICQVEQKRQQEREREEKKNNNFPEY